MNQICKTPAGEAGASRDHLGGWSRCLPTLAANPAQFLIAVHNVRPEMAAKIVALAFGGGAHG
ncbi:MAG: hypothetical protein R3D89_11705 [Sphingomonadaceae bacterium]